MDNLHKLDKLLLLFSADRKSRMLNNNKIAGKTARIFEDGVNYTIKTPERPYKCILEDKTVIYLNKKQINFMMKEVWEEKDEKKILSRCVIGSDKNGLKRCRKDCANCKWYKTPYANSGKLSLDGLEDEGFDIIDEREVNIFATDYAAERLHKAIDNLDDEIDTLIMNLKLEGLTETEIGKKLGISQTAVAKRRKKIFLIIYNEIKDLRD